MKVSSNSKAVFRFPTVLVFNCFSTGIIRRKMRKSGISLTPKQTVLLMREVRRCKKRIPNWNIVEITQSNGNKVTIEI